MTSTTQSTVSHIASLDRASSGSSPNTSTLSFPTVTRLGLKGSFANLARLVGLSKVDSERLDINEEGTDNEEDGEDREDEGDVDEEGLLWDAQTALIAHHTDIAIKLYTQAALPPYRSAAACLALGNLLIRGSGFDREDTPSSPSEATTYDRHDSGPESDARAGTTNGFTSASGFFSRLFGYPSTASPITAHVPSPSPPLISPPVSRRVDLVRSRWEIPKDGKRAVRDVKGMGVAGAWFVLGLGWLVQDQLERERRSHQATTNNTTSSTQIQESRNDIMEDGEEEMLSFDPKGKNKVTHHPTQRPSILEIKDLSQSTASISSEASDSTITMSGPRSRGSGSGFTEESSMIRTPFTDGRSDPFDRMTSGNNEEQECLKTMAELLQPLLQLYRHGHIQSHDPVALPPISLQQLPPILRPRNESEKGRNVWYLGKAVAQHMTQLKMLKPDDMASGRNKKEAERLRNAVNVMGRYLLASTASDAEAEAYFRTISSYSPTGMDNADDLILQAAKRLKIMTSTPRDESGSSSAFPFPTIGSSTLASSSHKRPAVDNCSPKRKAISGRHRQSSLSSISSVVSAPRILSTQIKSSPSVASLTTLAEDAPSPQRSRPEDDKAVARLRRLQAASTASELAAESVAESAAESQPESRWPSLASWRMSPPPLTSTDRLFDSRSPIASYRSNITIKPGRRASTTEHLEGHAGDSQFTVVPNSPTNMLRPVASTPHFGSLRAATLHEKASTAASTPRRRLPFEPSEAVAPIDAALAAAELSSALTKHVTCGVCAVKGVNFPECRKCGLTFCSRGCRVDEDKAGNGKRHICGMWESRRLLAVPVATVRRPSHNVPVRPVSPVRATKVF